MHILVVEALLVATYSTWGRANTYTHRKTLSVESLSRANSWSLSRCSFPNIRGVVKELSRNFLHTLTVDGNYPTVS
jgi:hypothetical protein